MGQDSSKSDREPPRQSRQEFWQTIRNPPPHSTEPPRQSQQEFWQTIRNPPPHSTVERQRNPYRYTGENLQSTVIPASVYPDLSRVNTATTQRVAPHTTNATVAQRVAPPTANTTTQRVASPTVIPAQQDTSPVAGHNNCYSSGASGANGSTQRVATPTANVATTQRVASPTVIPAQKDVSPASRVENLKCHSGANGSCARKETDEFVFVNNYVQQQFQTPKPSAPPAQSMPLFESSKLRPSRPSPPRTLTSPSNASASEAPAQNNQRSRSASRVRSPDDRFNCPSCGLLLGVTIFFCQRGHSACLECQQGNILCGEKIRPGVLCRTPIGTIRNISVEAMVADHLILQRSVCPNAGCTLSYNMADMAQHQRVCPFGETDCPMGTLFGQCQQRYKVDDMASHFDAFHREQRVADFGKEMFIFNCMESQKVFLIKNGPYNFLIHVKVAEQQRNIYMTVQLFGTAVSASKWSYEFHVYNKAQPRRKFMFVDNCHSVATPVNDIFTEAKCAAIPLNFAKTFVNEGVLTYKFYVKKSEMNKPTRRNNWKRQNQQV